MVRQGILSFDSLTEVSDFFKKNGNGYQSLANQWAGGTVETMFDRLHNGWQEGADKIAAKFDSALARPVSTVGKRIKYDVAGGGCSVSRYVAGSPMHMKRQRQAESIKAPIRVFASVCASSGIDADTMNKRGIAIASLVMYLSVQRPVELFIFAEMNADKLGEKDYCIPVIKLGISPFNLAEMAFAVCDPMALRRMMFGLRGTEGGDIRWAWDARKNAKDLKAKMTELLSLSDSDIVLPGSYLEEGDWGNPEAWLERQMKELGLLAE